MATDSQMVQAVQSMVNQHLVVVADGLMERYWNSVALLSAQSKVLVAKRLKILLEHEITRLEDGPKRS